MSKQTRIQFSGGKLALASDGNVSCSTLTSSHPPTTIKKKRKMINHGSMHPPDNPKSLPDQSTRPKVQLTYPDHILHGFPYQPIRLTFDRDPRCVQRGSEWCPWYCAMDGLKSSDTAWWLKPITLMANLIDPSMEMMRHIVMRELDMTLPQIESMSVVDMVSMFDNVIMVMLPEPPSVVQRCHPMARLVDIPKLFTETMYESPTRYQPILYMFHQHDLIHVEYVLPEVSNHEMDPTWHPHVDAYGRVRLSHYGVPVTPTGLYEWHDNDDMKKCAQQHQLDLDHTPKRLLGGNTSCLTDYRQRRFIIPKTDLDLMAPTKFKVYGLPSNMTLTMLIDPYIQSQPMLTSIRHFDTMQECEAYVTMLKQDYESNHEETASFIKQVQDQWIHQDEYLDQYSMQHPNMDMVEQQHPMEERSDVSDDHVDPTPWLADDPSRLPTEEVNAISGEDPVSLGGDKDASLQKQEHIGYAIARDVLLLWLFLEHLQIDFKLHVDQNLVKVQSIGIFFETPEQLTQKLPNYLSRCATFIDRSADQTELYNYQTGQMDVWRTKSELEPVDWQVLSTLLIPEPMRSYLIVYYEQARLKQAMEQSKVDACFSVEHDGNKDEARATMAHQDASYQVFRNAVEHQKHIYHKAAPLSALQHEQILDAYYWVYMAADPKPEYRQVLHYYEERGYAIRIKHGYVRTGRHSGRCSASGHRRNYDPIRQSAYSIPSKYTRVDEQGQVVAIVRQPRPTKSKYAHLARQYHQTPFEYDLFKLGIKENLKRPMGEIGFLMKSVHHRHKPPEEIIPPRVDDEDDGEDGHVNLEDAAVHHAHKDMSVDPNAMTSPEPVLSSTTAYATPMSPIPPIDASVDDHALLTQSFDGCFEPIPMNNVYSSVPEQEANLDMAHQWWDVVSEPFDHQVLWTDEDQLSSVYSGQHSDAYGHDANAGTLVYADPNAEMQHVGSEMPSETDQVSADVARVFAWHGRAHAMLKKQHIRRHYKKKPQATVVPLNLSNIIPIPPSQPTQD